MKCYNHSLIDAVAVCRACGRGLCRDCIVEVGLGSSCRNRCEAEVANYNELMERGRKAYHKTSATYYRAGSFMLLMGTLFAGFGWFGVQANEAGAWSYFLLIMGLLFIGWGISNFVAGRRFSQK